MIYSVHRYEHGLLIKAPEGVAIRELDAIGAMAYKLGYDIADAIISQHYGAVLALTSEEGSKHWRISMSREENE